MADVDPKLQSVLNQIKPFGFEFYGYDENSVPLVKGPNQQIADINVAIRFVNQQIDSQQSSNSSGLESGPSMNQNLDVAVSSEQGIETGLEQQSQQLEQAQENKQGEESATQPYQVKQNAPQVTLQKPKKVFYGDGFDPATFDPNNIRSALSFIENNSKKHNTKSDKWLAILFDKFVKEQKMGLKN